MAYSVNNNVLDSVTTWKTLSSSNNTFKNQTWQCPTNYKVTQQKDKASEGMEQQNTDWPTQAMGR